MSSKGTLIVISGPSGSGKGTVVKSLMEMMPDLGFSVSATTRAPREGEVDGRDYFFISRDDFEEMIEDGDILEYTTYCGNYYGTPKKEAERITGEGRDLILEIEVDGASQVKKKFPGAVTVMLIPPSLSVLEERLRGRGTESDEVIKKRLERACEEIKLAYDYDYVVVNENGGVEACARKIKRIINAERSRSARMTETVDNFINR
ncbi:MAG: guanylate kinase [Ruminococcaceae bacterium]|nr:guanylate kinase [Oscillospiraceae bacterium]